MPYIKVMPKASLGRTYVRGEIPWSYRRRLRAVPARPVFRSPVYAQFAPVRRWIKEVAVPAKVPLGEFGRIVPFVDQPDPVAWYIRGIQVALGVEASGKWDRATHEALAAYVERLRASLPGSVSLAAWGQNPAAVGNLVIMLLTLLSTPSAWATPDAKAAEFAAGWGIPATNATEMSSWAASNTAALAKVLPKVDEQIVVTESGDCVSWLTTGLIGVGALLVGGGIGYLVWGRGK